MRRLENRALSPRQLSGDERVRFMLSVLETDDGTWSVVRGFKSHFPDERDCFRIFHRTTVEQLRKIQHGGCSSIGRVLGCDPRGSEIVTHQSPKNAKGGAQKKPCNSLKAKMFFENLGKN